MRIPKRVKVGALKYRVKRCSVPLLDSQACYGTQSAKKGIIKITTSKRICRQQKENTLIHEIIHAISDDRDLELTENQVKSLSYGICQSFKNAKLNFGKKK